MYSVIRNNLDRIFCGIVFAGILLIAIVSETEAAQLCDFDNGYEYCDYGCCDNACCGMSTLGIVGLVIGSLISLAAIVGCIVCLACMCKQKSASGTVVQPYNNNSSSVFVHHTSPYHHPPPRPPPSYDQYNTYPGSSNTSSLSSEPVYPPGYMQNEKHPPPPYNYTDPQPRR